MPTVSKSQIETPTDSYVARYPWAVEKAIEQQSIFWPAEELGVEEDEQDFRTNLNPAELHGIITAQSILTQYELMIGGEEFWGGKIAKLFPRPEIQRLCAVISNVELNSHAPFYNIGNEVMGNATDDFYTQWKADPILAERIEFIHKVAASDDALEVTAAVAFLEGAVLFSAFGFFKGFNSRGFNFIPHFVSGIDGSAKDENLHSMCSAMLFQQCKKERTENGNHTKEEEVRLSNTIQLMAHVIALHEKRINSLLFEVPGNRVITLEELNHFTEDRINIVLARLGQEPMFNTPSGVVSGWFYDQLSTVKVPDFFAATQLQYRRNWARHQLTFRKELANEL